MDALADLSLAQVGLIIGITATALRLLKDWIDARHGQKQDAARLILDTERHLRGVISDLENKLTECREALNRARDERHQAVQDHFHTRTDLTRCLEELNEREEQDDGKGRYNRNPEG